MKAELKTHASGVSVLIDGDLHLFLANGELVGMHSYAWKDTNGEENAWHIDFHLNSGNTVHAEYDSRDKWLTILRLFAGLFN